jgi:TPP-dependent pyruvate/acetoin dehydrogenase alpha subunit
MHLVDEVVSFKGSTAIVGNTIPIGVGLALSIQLNDSDQVSCVYFGDGAVEEGVFYESVNFAAVRKLPVLFVCENNLYSVYSPLSVRQPANRKIHEMVEAIGVESHHCDGNDAEKIMKLAKSSIAKIRDTGLPQFLEFSTYRWREHCGPNYDNDAGYRSQAEFELWKGNDPIYQIKNKLGLADSTNMKYKEDIQKEINEAFDFAETSSFPTNDKLFNHIYK